MKPNETANFFIDLAYWIILAGFLTWTVTHYHAIFHAREIPGPLRDFNSWQIGIVIEGGYALFQLFFMRTKGKSKYFFLVVWLALIYFFQYQYYEATEPILWKRLIFAAVFPFILSMFTWMGDKKKELKESMAHGAGGKQVNSTLSRYSKEELEILESAGVNLDGNDSGPGSGAPEQPEPEPEPEPEPQTIKIPEHHGHSSGTNHPHPKTLMKKFGKPLLVHEDGSVKCQYCGETAVNAQAMRRIHSLLNCFTGWYKAKQREVNNVGG